MAASAMLLAVFFSSVSLRDNSSSTTWTDVKTTARIKYYYSDYKTQTSDLRSLEEMKGLLLSFITINCLEKRKLIH